MALSRQRKQFWQFRAAADDPKTGELLIYGPISNTSWWGDEVTPRQFHEDLRALGDIDELRVYINSGGGDAFAGQTIHSILRRHKARVVTYVDGLAASAASVIAMAGDTVVMPRNAMMMVHNPWTFAWGEASELRKVADTLDQVRETLVAVYEEKTGLDRDRIIELLDAETWMTAEEAKDLGFADEIDEAKEVAASLRGDTLVINGQEHDLSPYRSRPKVSEADAKGPNLGTITIRIDPGDLIASINRATAEDGTKDKLRLLALEYELLTGKPLEGDGEQ